jgi:biotin transport system substrate-specific component
MAALTAIGGWCTVQVPFSPVPYTLQTFFVLFSGFMLGPWGGAMSQVIYILMGCVGIPVFSGFSAGPGALIGPTGGFLLGFIPASMLCGFYMKRNPGAGAIGISLAGCAALALIYLPGALWLSLYLSSGVHKALFTAVIPFLPGDVIKLILCTVMVIRMRKIMGKELPLER